MAETDDPADLPLVDVSYLTDLRQWVGRDSYCALLDDARDQLRRQCEELTAIWRSAGLAEAREAAHRLAGAAGSVGAHRLNGLARQCQMADADSFERVLAATSSVLEPTLAALEECLAAA